MHDDVTNSSNLKQEDHSENILLDENAKAEAEKYLKKRMNWTPRNEYEEDLYQMGLQSLLDNYI